MTLVGDQLARDLARRSPLGPRPERVDTRTKDGKRWKHYFLGEAIRLREQHYSLTEISAAIGVNTTTLSMWMFVAGRSDLVYRDVERRPADGSCHACGKVLPDTGRQGRRRKYCDEECRAEATGAKPRRERQAHLVTEAQERQRCIAEFRRIRREGGHLPWQLGRPERQHTEDETRELESLITRQEREMRRREISSGERPKGSQSPIGWGAVSLDEPVENRSRPDKQGDKSYDRYDGFDGKVVPSAEDEYLAAEEGEIIRSVLGSLTIEDVARLSGERLDYLRERLRGTNAYMPKVTTKERQRLRVNERHRGYSPPATFQHMSTKKRRRKDQIELMTGKRPSRKQPRRWTREKVVAQDWKGEDDGWS